MNPIELTTAIEKLTYECHQNSVLHGFYDCPDGTSVPAKIALMHTELSELFEGFRRGKNTKPDEHCPDFTNEEIELADLLIRAFDYAGWRQLRLGGAILAKHEYNKTRPYLHNKTL
jgi:NTP pyrophosphatase (non-canonical NTP hydrolase)